MWPGSSTYAPGQSPLVRGGLFVYFFLEGFVYNYSPSWKRTLVDIAQLNGNSEVSYILKVLLRTKFYAYKNNIYF